jgi:hypothetical protein
MASALRRIVEPQCHLQMQAQTSHQQRDEEKKRSGRELVEHVIDVRSEFLCWFVLGASNRKTLLHQPAIFAGEHKCDSN